MKILHLLREVIYTPISLCKGLWVTFINFWRRKVTLQYPDERWELPEGYRGVPSLPKDPVTGTHRCIACGSCARICPEQIISIEHEVGEDKKRKVTSFKIDISRCMFCGLCSEACPTKGLVMSKTYELSCGSREDMVFDLERLQEIGGVFPEDSKKRGERYEPAQAGSNGS